MKERLIILTGPSGVGKNAVLQKLQEINPKVARLITCTTRKPRLNEVNGKDYYFIDVPTFLSKESTNQFIETVFIHENFYGTLKEELVNLLQTGKILVCVIESYGASILKKEYPKAITIFLHPPSLSVLFDRLKGRNSESDEQLVVRFENALSEIDSSPYLFKYHLKNKSIEKTAKRVNRIIKWNIFKLTIREIIKL